MCGYCLRLHKVRVLSQLLSAFKHDLYAVILIAKVIGVSIIIRKRNIQLVKPTYRWIEEFLDNIVNRPVVEVCIFGVH